jgi:branched-chain amino acid transport system permease protein
MVVSAGYISQVSLAQVTIAGLAAYMLAGLTTGLHVPFPFAPLLSVIGAGLLGFLVGIPALRIRGAQLMVVSLAFAVAINRLVLQNGELGNSAFGLTVAPAHLFGFDLGTFGPGGFPAPRSVAMIVLIAGASFLAIANLRRARTGLRWLAVRGNEGAAAACGIDVVRTKLLASAISVGLAGVAGVLIAQNSQSLSYRLFDTDIALALVALAYLGGVASIWGAIVAGLLAAGGILEQLFGIGIGAAGDTQLYGVALILVCMFAPGGLAGIGASASAWVRGWWRRFGPGSAAGGEAPASAEPLVARAGSGLG